LKQHRQNDRVFQDPSSSDFGTFSLDAPLFTRKTVQAYLGFVSASGKQVSSSLYAGEAKVL